MAELITLEPSVADHAMGGLSQVEIGVIDFFVSAVRVLGLPKSIGEIYGMLFISPQPLPLDALCQKLNMSKGSASQGLKVLRTFGAVRAIYQAGDRRDHFSAEVEIRRLAAGFVREQIQPRLSHGEGRLEQLNRMGQTLDDDGKGEFVRERLSKLNRWSERSREVLPLIGGLLD